MELLEKFKHINTFIFDVDGVLTNGSVHVTDSGEGMRVFNIKDGYALQLAVKKGYRVAIISGGRGEHTIKRLQGLGIQDIFLGAHDKLQIFKDYTAENDLHPHNILYMGDDIPDWEVMKRVGLATCPNDAASEIIQISHYVSPKNGGEGCARDVIEKSLRTQEKWFDTTSFTW